MPMRLPGKRPPSLPEEARINVARRGRFLLAVSGGHTPWIMLRALADETVPWAGVHVAQVDERVAPQGDPDRNLTHFRESLLDHAPVVSSKSMPCRWNPPTWRLPLNNMRRLSRRSPARRQYSTLSIWDSDPMGTRPLWCLEIPYLRLPTRTWQ